MDRVIKCVIGDTHLHAVSTIYGLFKEVHNLFRSSSNKMIRSFSILIHQSLCCYGKDLPTLFQLVVSESVLKIITLGYLSHCILLLFLRLFPSKDKDI